MPIDVLVVGRGALRTSVAERLSRPGSIAVAQLESIDAMPTAALARVTVAVHCADGADTATANFVRICREAAVSSVVGRLTERTAVVALDLPRNRSEAASGCPECARLHTETDLSLGLDAQNRKPTSRRYDPEDIDATANLIALAVCKALEVAQGLRPADVLATAFDFDSRGVTVEPVHKHPACRVCVPAAPADSSELRAEVMQWRDRCLRAPGTPGDIATLLSGLRTLAGKRFALFGAPNERSPVERNAVWQFFRARGLVPKNNPLANAYFVPTLGRRGHDVEPWQQVTVGFDFTNAGTAEAISLVEGLERVFAMSFCPPHRVVKARYSDVARDALDPRRFPLFAEMQYAQPGFPLRRFDPDAHIDWIWGLDLASGAPVLVAFDLVFASSPSTRIYRANSNGAACHTSVHQAIVNGIYETVERDALMVTWLNELSLPRLVLGEGAPDPWSVRGTLERLDFHLVHVDISTDLDIPVLLAVLKDRRNPDFFLLDMVASVDAHAQLCKLYRELAQFVHPYLVDGKHLVNVRMPDDDPQRVCEFPDHVAYYQAEHGNRRADFLTAGAATRQLGQGAAYAAANLDRREEMDLLVARLAANGYPVIVVDCTSPPLGELGLHAVKVLIPGLQPLNCGHHLRALGGERVVTVAHRMGYAPRRRTLDELNPWPHPFW